MWPKQKLKRKHRKPTDAAKVWQSLSDRFTALADVESRQGGEYCPLLLACFYPDMEAANPVGSFDKGKWELYDGLNFQAEYRRIAIDAGRAMGAERIIRFEVWAHHLGWYVMNEKLPYEFNREYIQIRNLCQVSGAFCKWLRDQAQAPETPAFERIMATYPGVLPDGRPPSQSRLPQPLEQSESANDSKRVEISPTANSAKTAQSVESKPKSLKAERSNPEVAKRTVLVRSNPDASAEVMCQIFDRERVPLSAKWLEAGLRTWSKAYKDSNYRRRIHILISKDRRRN